MFIAEVKGYIPEMYYNEFVNFPPIIRNIEIDINEETVGSYMMKIIEKLTPVAIM